MPTNFDDVLETAADWTDDHPYASMVLGYGAIIGLYALSLFGSYKLVQRASFTGALKALQK